MRLHGRRAIRKRRHRIRRNRNDNADLAFGRRDDGNGRCIGIRRDDVSVGGAPGSAGGTTATAGRPGLGGRIATAGALGSAGAATAIVAALGSAASAISFPRSASLSEGEQAGSSIARPSASIARPPRNTRSAEGAIRVTAGMSSLPSVANLSPW